MRLKKTAGVAAGLVAMFALAACGGNSSSPAANAAGASEPASSPGAPASAPVVASAPVAPVAQTVAFDAYNYQSPGMVGTAATLAFPAAASGVTGTAGATGTLSLGTTNYATLTADAANDAVMTVTGSGAGTPNYGITLGQIPIATPVLLPGIVEACEAVAGQGAPNPAIGNAPTKSTYVMFAGLPSTDLTIAAGRTFPVYYEDCMRDGNPVTPAVQSSLIIDDSGNATFFDSRTSATKQLNELQTFAEIGVSALTGAPLPDGNNGDWLVPFLYIVNGEYRLALIEHGTIADGNTRDYIGVWLEQQ
jgi:hypothetical protein